MKWLIIEEPFMPAEIVEWNAKAVRELCIDDGDKESLEAGETVFRSGTALSLEDQEA